MIGKVQPAAAGRRLAEYLTVGQAAAFVGVSTGTLRNWDNSGKLKTVRHPQNGYRLYRREQLEALLQDDGLKERLHERFTPGFDSSRLGRCGHLVQFYERHAFLAATVSRFIAASRRAGEGAVLITTAAHRSEIQRRLRARGVDPAAARAEGRLVMLDAAETLAAFMVNGSPDPRRFRRVVGGTIARVGDGRPGVRAFGEMVAVLWAAGRPGAALRLERLWNELRATHRFVLQCAYPMSAFATGDPAAFGRVCASHSRVLPAESYARLSTDDDRLRAIACLQQKVRTLEAEVARHRQIERH